MDPDQGGPEGSDRRKPSSHIIHRHVQAPDEALPWRYFIDILPRAPGDRPLPYLDRMKPRLREVMGPA